MDKRKPAGTSIAPEGCRYGIVPPRRVPNTARSETSGANVDDLQIEEHCPMDSVVGALTFIVIVCGALAGVWLSRRLPEQHLSGESRTAVSVSVAVVGTLSALVMGLLISSASSSFNAKSNAVHTLAVDIIRLDRALRQYGPQAESVRISLKSYAQTKAEELSNRADRTSLDLTSLAKYDVIMSQVIDFQPVDNRQRQMQVQAMRLLDSIADARWLL